ASGPYQIPHVRIEAFCVYTNLPPSGYMRAPGHPQVAFAVEAHMDLLARSVGMDPLQFRFKNALRQGAEGQPSLARPILEAAADALGLDVTSTSSTAGAGVSLNQTAGSLTGRV